MQIAATRSARAMESLLSILVQLVRRRPIFAHSRMLFLRNVIRLYRQRRDTPHGTQVDTQSVRMPCGKQQRTVNESSTILRINTGEASGSINPTITASISNVLKKKDAEKHTTYDQYMTAPFYPLSFSSGGAYSPVCEPVFAHW